jgi:limonene 1,2-monooxygenase
MPLPLRHGLFLAPFHSVKENPTLSLERDLQLCSLADQLGFDEAWIGEHHSGGMEIINSPEVFIAAAAERTKGLKLGTGVVSLPYHNPLNVANRIIQLDHMTRGRVMFGVGPGLLASDALMMGIEPATTRDRLEQGLHVILRLLRGEVVNEVTDWYSLRDARTHLRPYTYPHPEVCVASAVTPSGGRLAGRYDVGMLCMAAGEQAGFDALDTNWQIACDIAKEDGREMDRDRLRCVVMMHLAETREQARREAQFGCEEFIRYRNNNQHRYDVPEGTDYVDWSIENGVAVVGTPQDAIDIIEALQKKQGEFGCLLQVISNWADWPARQRSLELYAEYVMPYFAGSNQSRVASYQWVADHNAEVSGKRVAAIEQMFAKHNSEYSEKGKRNHGESR